MRSRAALVVVAAAVAVLGPAAQAHGAPLEAGVGRADITPPTGYPFGGWVRADRTGQGQHTRLYSTAMVLQRGDRKVALVAVDLFAAPGGLVKAAANRAHRGFDERNVLVSASHTHAGPSGFANFETYNTIAPSVETIDDPGSFVDFLDPQPADRRLYTFLVERVATALRRAHADLAPATAGWGSSRIVGLTDNRSIEAHLANHGIIRRYGQGSVGEDPGGYEHTIDPRVNVLRVDKVESGRRVPIGAWSTFANHGTVNPAEFEVYNQDHHGAATRVFARRVRGEAEVPRGQLVVNAYGNSNEGDQSAGLGTRGPAYAERVGRREADAMFDAWRRAGRDLSRSPALASRWTRVCFCGQHTEGGQVASSPAIGLPFLTGSEEGRGPLFDVTGVPFEGRRSPLPSPGQGHKLGVQGIPSEDTVPEAVPLLALRVGDRLIGSLPGEATKEVGHRTRAALRQATGGSGVERMVISGLANEFLQYFTTPEEYDRQHYEGGSTLFGPLASNLLIEELAELARRLVNGRPAQEPYPFDPRNGVRANGRPFPRGAESGTIVDEPRREYRRLRHAELTWEGGRRGFDRPLDRAFVVVQRRDDGRWRRASTDLGLEIVWRVNEDGRYEAMWEIPRGEPRGVHRFKVSARRYELVSRGFWVRASRELEVEELEGGSGRVAVRLGYPEAVPLRDFTFRPQEVNGGSVRFLIGDREVVAERRTGSRFSVPAPPGAGVTIPAGGARDRFGNRNDERVHLR